MISELTPEAKIIEGMFQIQSKTGERVPFKLNVPQRKYDSMRTKRDIIPKARQEGFSSLGIAYQTVDCLGKEGTRAVLISHEAKATQRLLDKAGYYIRNLRGASATLGRHSRNEFYFPETESSFYIGTAGAKAFGRGDTINHLHISEYAWWESDALKQVAGLFQAVPLGGTIRIESTGRGRQNDFYYIIKNCEQLGYNVCFFAWWENPEYQLPLPANGFETPGFEDYFNSMQNEFSLSDEQLYFYWMKLLEFRQDLRYMQQEYPSKLDECFQATGGAIFPDVSKVKSEYWKYRLETIKGVQQSVRVDYLATHPKRDHTYIIGGDPSGGTGNDETATQIICMETLEQVLEAGSNLLNPVDYAYWLVTLGKLYNNAFMIIEGNNHGIATNAALKDMYPGLKIYKKTLPSRSGIVRYGYNTTNESKKAMIGAIHSLFDDGFTIYGKRTLEQLEEFEEDPITGKIEGPMDDLVIALGLAAIGYYKWQRFAYRKPQPKQTEQHTLPDFENMNLMYTTLDEMLESINNKHQKPSSILPNMLRS